MWEGVGASLSLTLTLVRSVGTHRGTAAFERGAGMRELPSNSPAGPSQRAFAAEPMLSSSGHLRKEHRVKVTGYTITHSNTNEILT